MQPQTHTKQQAAAQPAPQRDMSKVYFWGPNDESENLIALEWLAKHYPDTGSHGQVRYTTALNLDKLTDEHTVIVLARTKKRTHARETERDQHGIAKVVQRKPEDLIGEIVESPPVHCKDHWQGQEYGTEGELNVNTFMNAIGKVCTPFHPKPSPQDSRVTPRTYKLGWA